jgi:hypothetical protein
MLLEGRPKRYYIFCVVRRARPSHGEIGFGDSGRLARELYPDPHFFACLLKICNGPEIALPIRSSCELRM